MAVGFDVVGLLVGSALGFDDGSGESAVGLRDIEGTMDMLGCTLSVGTVVGMLDTVGRAVGLAVLHIIRYDGCGLRCEICTKGNFYLLEEEASRVILSIKFYSPVACRIKGTRRIRIVVINPVVRVDVYLPPVQLSTANILDERNQRFLLQGSEL